MEGLFAASVDERVAGEWFFGDRDGESGSGAAVEGAGREGKEHRWAPSVVGSTRCGCGSGSLRGGHRVGCAAGSGRARIGCVFC